MPVANKAHDQDTQALYRDQGMGLRIPPGERPAVLVIDMQHDFCDPDSPTTLWPSIGRTYEPIRQLCSAAREDFGVSNRNSTPRCASRSKAATVQQS